MGVEIRRRPRMPRFDGRVAAALIKSLVPAWILKRANRGISADDVPFHPYSERHLAFLAAMAEDTKVDLRLTGGLLNSVKARNVEIEGTRLVVTIAPDTGTSPRVTPPSLTKELAKTNAQRGGTSTTEGTLSGPLRRGASTKLGQALTPRMIKTGERGPAHNELAHWIHYGTKRMPARRFLALTEREEKELRAEIEKVCFTWR